MSVVISMLVGSKFSNWALVKNSIETIRKNIGISDYLLVIGVARYISEVLFYRIKALVNLDKRIIVIEEHCETFATFTNHVIQNYSINSKWFIVAHDDIKLKTKNFIPTVEETLSSLKEDIGWISFTDDDYLNGNWAPSTRPGYHIDFLNENAWGKRKMFQFHNLELDFPTAPVKCHAPFSHFIMIESEKLKQIGLCENWSVVSLLIDEDWGLSAMKEGLANIWIPSIVYTHCRSVGTRAGHIIKEQGTKVAGFFYKKWGFNHRPKATEIGKIKKLHKEIVWSSTRRSFEWEYV